MTKKIENNQNFSLLDAIPEGLFVLNKELKVLFWNNILEDWTKISRKDIIDNDIKGVFPQLVKPPYADSLQQVFDGGAPILFSPDSHKSFIQSYLPNGKHRIFQTVVTAIKDTGDASKFNALFTLQDVTDSTERLREYRILHEKTKKAEEAIKTAKLDAESANRAKSEFLANMSHEIRSPMNAILGYAQILKRKKLDDENQKSVNNILSSGDHLLTLINDILDISKIEAGRMEANHEDFDLTELIQSLEVMFRPKCDFKNLKFTVNGLGANPILVNGDNTKIKQVLINLLSNAVKFTDSGNVQLDVHSNNSEYRFEVVDTGVGIPKEAQKSIFDPFKQEREGVLKGGTGLGLAIAKRQIELMDGKLELISADEKGTKFSLTLQLPPALESCVSQSKNVREVKRLSAGYHVKALVADDIKMNREVLENVLKEVGIEVITAENGQEAVNLVREFLPDIVFMDIRMPVMNGLDAMRIIKSEYSSQLIKVVAITASVLDNHRKLVIELGADDFISKPFRLDDIFSCVKKLLLVEFDYQDNISSDSKELELSKIDSSKISFSKTLHSELIEAARLHSLTHLDKLLLELEKENNGEVYSIHIKSYMSKYDMQGLLKFLGETT
jgi:signal transduction histidine kinase/DNA-binding response OmpR family regulator